MHASPTSDEYLPAVIASPAEIGQSDIVTAEIVAPTVRPPRNIVQLSPAVAGLLNNRLAVIALLAFVGPIGLPALWFSGRFGRTTKIVATAIFVLISVVFPLAVTYYCCEIALRPLVDAFSQS